MIINLLIIIAILLAIDIYTFLGIRKILVFSPFAKFNKLIVRAYWFMDIGFIVFAIAWATFLRNSGWPDHIQYRNYFYITGAFILIFLPKMVFLIFNLVHDLGRIVKWMLNASQLIKRKNFKEKKVSSMLTAGFILSLMMFAWVFYGVAFGRYNFRVNEVTVSLENLPESFDGFRIIHISDTHLGSFVRKRPVERGVQKIKDTPHDLLLFTGDMVNNEAVEAQPFVDAFARIVSPYGKFSVLGNHDLGDYRRWYTIEEKKANLQQLKDYQQQMGFDLLRNQHRFLVRGADSIMIAGVDNWGLPPFAQLGDIEQALGDHADHPVIILLSHDPSHWTEEVIPLTDISLTLSGHTHGMQAGIRTPWFRWSPVQFKYPNWNGLYSSNNQYLYVNRGFGFIGFPGRLGMPPEITLIVLKRKE